MRDESMIQVLKKAGRDQESIEIARHKAYQWVGEFYVKKQSELLKQLEELNLLKSILQSSLTRHS